MESAGVVAGASSQGLRIHAIGALFSEEDPHAPIQTRGHEEAPGLNKRLGRRAQLQFAVGPLVKTRPPGQDRKPARPPPGDAARVLFRSTGGRFCRSRKRCPWDRRRSAPPGTARTSVTRPNGRHSSGRKARRE